MRLALVSLASVLWLLAPAIGRAQSPIEMAFDDCPGGPAAAAQRADACASNTGSAMDIVVSFIPPMDIPNLLGVSAEIRIHPAGLFDGHAPVRDWWRLQDGGCRANAATVDVTVPDLSVCSDPWGGASTLTGAFFHEIPPNPIPYPSGTPGYMRATVDVSVAEARAVQAGVKYQAFTLRILRARTVGPGSCAGCCAGACINLNRVELYYGTEVHELRSPPGQEQIVTWQGAQFDNHAGCWGPGCPVTARRGTWGQLKSLYR